MRRRLLSGKMLAAASAANCCISCAKETQNVARRFPLSSSSGGGDVKLIGHYRNDPWCCSTPLGYPALDDTPPPLLAWPLYFPAVFLNHHVTHFTFKSAPRFFRVETKEEPMLFCCGNVGDGAVTSSLLLSRDGRRTFAFGCLKKQPKTMNG